MHIYALLGSPRTAGNTRTLLDIVLEAAEQSGAQVELAELAKLENLTGCRECFACQEVPDAPGCAIDDDVQDVLSKAMTADVLLLATPVFCWSTSWLLKCVTDRMYCMFKFGGNDVRCLLQGRALAAVITGGGDANEGADLVEESFRRFARYSGCDWLGALIAAPVQSPEGIRANAELTQRAQAFGMRIAQPGE